MTTVALSSVEPVAPSWRPLASCVGAGIVAGVAYTMSPVLLWVVALAFALVWLAGHGLSSGERRWIRFLVLTALAVRVVAVVALFLASPHDDQSSAVLFGDEAYTHSRALRMRN